MSSDFKDSKDIKDQKDRKDTQDRLQQDREVKESKETRDRLQKQDILDMEESLARAKRILRENTGTSDIESELEYENEKGPSTSTQKYDRYHSFLSFFNPATSNTAYKGFLGAFVNFFGKALNFLNDQDCEELIHPTSGWKLFKALVKLLISTPGALLRVAANIVDFAEEAVFSPIKTLNNIGAAFKALVTTPPKGKYRVGEFMRNLNRHYQMSAPSKTPAPPANMNEKELTVLTLNMGCLRGFYWTFGGKTLKGEKSLNGLRRPEIRAAELADQLLAHEKNARSNPNIQSRDVIVFQEMFEPKAQAILIAKLRKEYPYIVYDIGQRRSPLVGSGIFIVSRYPIVDVEFHRYHNLKGLDIVSNKGFAAVKIKKGNTVHTVYSTHTQAGMGGVPTTPLEVLTHENSNDTTGARRAQALGHMISQHARFYREKPLPRRVETAKAGLEIYTGDVNQDLGTAAKAMAVSTGKKSSRKSGKVKYESQYDAMHHLKLQLPDNFVNLNISQAELELKILNEVFIVKNFVKNDRNEIVDIKLKFFDPKIQQYVTGMLSEEPLSSKFGTDVRKNILNKVNANRHLPYFPKVKEGAQLPSTLTLIKKTETIHTFAIINNEKFLLLDPEYDKSGKLTKGMKINMEKAGIKEPLSSADIKQLQEHPHIIQKGGLLKSEVFLKGKNAVEIVQARYSEQGQLTSGLKVVYDNKENITGFEALNKSEVEEINQSNEIAFLKHYAAAIPVLTQLQKSFELSDVQYKENGCILGGKIFDKELKAFRDLTSKEIIEINQLLTKKNILPHVSIVDNRGITFEVAIPEKFKLKDIQLDPTGRILDAKKETRGLFKTKDSGLTKNELDRINKYMEENTVQKNKLLKNRGVSDIVIKVEKEFEVVDYERLPEGNYTAVEYVDVDMEQGTAVRKRLGQEQVKNLNEDNGVSLEENRRKGLHPTKVLWDEYTFESLRKVNTDYANRFAQERYSGSSLTDEYLKDNFQDKVYQHKQFGGMATNKRLLDLNAPRNSPMLKNYNSKLVLFENQKKQAVTDHLGLESVYRLR